MKISVFGQHALVFTTHVFVKLNDEPRNKVTFENWKLGNTGNMTVEKYVIFHKQNDMGLVEINVIYLYFLQCFQHSILCKIFFLPCYMTCYDFFRLVKAEGRSRNFAISKMGPFVTVAQDFQSLTVVINSPVLEFKELLDPFLIAQ